MPADYFLDSNILVYMLNRAEQRKRAIAVSLVDRALGSGKGVISYQVVQEFLNVTTRKFTPPLKPADARAYLDTVLWPLCAVYPSEELYRQALEIMALTGFGFYDSLIVSAAVSGGSPRLYTEDLSHGRKILGVTITNPFL